MKFGRFDNCIDSEEIELIYKDGYRTVSNLTGYECLQIANNFSFCSDLLMKLIANDLIQNKPSQPDELIDIIATMDYHIELGLGSIQMHQLFSKVMEAYPDE